MARMSLKVVFVLFIISLCSSKIACLKDKAQEKLKNSEEDDSEWRILGKGNNLHHSFLTL